MTEIQILEGQKEVSSLEGTTIPIPPTQPPNIPYLLPTPIPLSHVKATCRLQSLKTWNQQWKHCQHDRQTKIVFPAIKPNQSNHLIKQPRDTFGRAVRWLTGHCFLNRHNNSLNPTEFPNPNCRLCNWDQETSSHIICECEALGLIRHFHFQELLLPLAPIPKIKQLTSYLNDPRINSLETLPHD